MTPIIHHFVFIASNNASGNFLTGACVRKVVLRTIIASVAGIAKDFVTNAQPASLSRPLNAYCSIRS